ncbi:MAG TPA: sialidase [Kofleriaceae bacterium]|nr:sialidase [Kofleriaceae bacterium]
MTKFVLATALTVVLAACQDPARDQPDATTGWPGDAGADGAVGPEVAYYTVTAAANYLLVAANDGGAGALVADRVAAAEWEHFEVIEHSDGTIGLRARANQRFVTLDDAARLVATATDLEDGERFERIAQADGTVALRALGNSRFVSADLNHGAALIADRPAVGGEWEMFRFDRVTGPAFGPNVLVFDPALPPALIQRRLDAVFARQEANHFGNERYAVLLAPGTYYADVNVGFYTEVLGLGTSPDDVTVRGAVRAEADWFDGNATQNFWRSVGNLAVEPTGGTNRWAVSQAAPFRRVHVRGNLILDDGGWSSGGFIADSLIDGQVDSGSQQQWLTRSARWGGWRGANWNMVFAGVVGAPAGEWPNPPYTVIDQVPVVREKPFLRVAGGAYEVFVPALRRDTRGATWTDGPAAGTAIPLDRFYIARADIDTAATLDAALADGKHLLFTPGIYRLDRTLHVTAPGTIVLGLGLATLITDGGVVAMEVADVDGVVVAGLLFDAGATSSPVLLRVGPTGSSASHAADPISLHDVFFRVGGAAVGRADVSLEINSDDVIADHLWVWRADHTHGVGWTVNTTRNGVIVNGDDVTMYGLFVEHYHQTQTLWNGERGRVYFYQSEIPYDVPNQAAWMEGGRNGFASYRVADGVTEHQAWGLGIYCFFNDNPAVKLESAIAAPNRPGVRFQHVVTVSLGGRGEITHPVNDTGAAARPGATEARVIQYP